MDKQPQNYKYHSKDRQKYQQTPKMRAQPFHYYNYDLTDHFVVVCKTRQIMAMSIINNE